MSPFLVPVFGSFFSSGFCFCENPPIWTGIFLAYTSIATIWWWKLSLRGWETPPATLRTIGTTSIALTITAGSIHLAREVLPSSRDVTSHRPRRARPNGDHLVEKFESAAEHPSELTRAAILRPNVRSSG